VQSCVSSPAAQPLSGRSFALSRLWQMKESSVAVSGFTHALELLRGRITAGFALVGRTAIFPGIDWCGYSSGHRYGAHGKGSCLAASDDLAGALKRKR
jgi:hypothetical protein